jgi:hypothetical protein
MKKQFKNIMTFIYDIFTAIIESIKNDNMLDMLMMWLIFVSVFIIFPLFFIIFIYVIIYTLPYICILLLFGILSFLIPLSLRTIYKLIKRYKKYEK